MLLIAYRAHHSAPYIAPYVIGRKVRKPESVSAARWIAPIPGFGEGPTCVDAEKLAGLGKMACVPHSRDPIFGHYLISASTAGSSLCSRCITRNAYLMRRGRLPELVGRRISWFELPHVRKASCQRTSSLRRSPASRSPLVIEDIGSRPLPEWDLPRSMHHEHTLTSQNRLKKHSENDRTRLPNEILMDVFEKLLNKPSDLVAVIRTCKHWHHIASTVLYQHISLDSKLREDTSGARFGRFAQQYHLIQSLSIRITQVHLMGFSVQSTDAFDRLVELCEAMRRMKHLRTFALSFEESLDHLEGFSVPSAVLVLILQSLPTSVVNLNLDCDCINRPDLDQPHVCHALSALLPRLRSLRLRTSHLCSGLLSSLFPTAALDHERPSSPSRSQKPLNRISRLEYLVISLLARPECAHLAHTALCYSGDKLLHGAKLASTLQELYNIGAFPSLCEFAVIGRVNAPSTPQNDNWNVFKVRTFARGISETTTLPWCARGGSSSLYMIRDRDGDWFGSFVNISNALEGPLAWTKTGIKATRYLKPYERSNDWGLDRTNLAPRNSVIEKFGVSFRLWKHESETQVELLSARKAAGFVDTAVASQILPDGWRWVIADGPWNWTIEPIVAY